MRAFTVSCTTYSIPVSLEEFQAFDDSEIDWDDSLAAAIDNLDGCYDTEYNRHFGLFVHVSITADHDNLITQLAIVELMRKFFKGSES